MHRTKVFGIGFQKTGTKSLADALKLLGYRVTGPNFLLNRNLEVEVRERAFAMAERYDAFQDNPWGILYKELDERFPGSRFILTRRPTDKWIASVVRHFGTRNMPMRKWIYGKGCPVGNEEIYTERYERHNREVLDYFRDRPDDLLLMDITQSDGWEVLCPFLGHAIPETPFPHSNTAEAREAEGRPQRGVGFGNRGFRRS